MAETKEYKIVINGLTESVKAVDALSDSLQFLDKKIKELESRSVNISSTSSGSNYKSLQSEDTLLKQIQKTEQEIVNARREEYNQLLADKDLLKQTKDLAEQRAASERLAASNYANTMQGMKQELADIKKVMNTTNIDSDNFKQMTARAGELTGKLKELEQSYGQFSRNVGNYKSAAEDLQKIKVNVSGVDREFNSARDATKTLNNELKAMAVNGQQNTKQYKELRQTILELESTMGDAKKPMDDLMDSMESVVAVASVGKGLGAFFGVDDSQIQKSIQQLMALQTALKGIQAINKQIETREGIGKWIAPLSSNLDKANFKLKRFTVSMLGTGTAAKTAAAGINLVTNAAKLFAGIGLAGMIMLAVTAVEKIVESISDWVKGDADLISAEDALTDSLNQQNKVLNENLDLIQKRVDAGEITAEQARIEREEAYAKAIEETKKKLIEREQVYQQAGIVQSGKVGINLENIYGDTGVTSIGGFDEGIKSIEDFKKRWDLLSTAVANGTDALNKWNYTADDAKDDLAHMVKLVGGDLVNAFTKFADGTTEGTKQLVEYINHMDELTGGRYTQALKLGIDKGFLDGQFKMAFEQYEKLKKDIYKSPLVAKLQLETDIKTALDGIDPTRRIKEDINKWNEILKKGVNEAGQTLTMEERASISKIITAREKELKETRNRTTSKISSNYKKYQKEVTSAEEELNRLRIGQMKDGLIKTITQLEEERKAKIAKIKLDGKMVGELTEETNKFYDKKIEDAKKEHAKKVVEINQDMYDSMLQQQIDYLNSSLNNAKESESIIENQFIEKQNEYFNQNVGSYGISGKNTYRRKTANALGIASTIDHEMVNDYKKLIDLRREASIAESALGGNKIVSVDKITEAEKNLLKVEKETAKKLKQLEWDKAFMFDEEYEKRKYDIEKELDIEKQKVAKLKEISSQRLSDVESENNKVIKAYHDYYAELQKKYSTAEDQAKANAVEQTLIEENYSKSLSLIFKQRLTATQAFWNARVLSVKESAEKVYDEELKLAKANHDKEIAEEDKNWNNLVKIQDKWLKAEKESIEQQAKDEKWTKEHLDKALLSIDNKYNREATQAYETHKKKLEEIDKIYSNKQTTLQTEKNNKLKASNTEYYQEVLQEFRDFQTAINNLYNKQPVKNEWGIINLKKTKENNDNLRASYEELLTNIRNEKTKLNEDFKNGMIDKDVYDSSIRELDSFAEGIGERIEGIGVNFGDFWEGINNWLQQLGSTFNSILGSLSEITSNHYDKQISQQEKYIDEYEKLLDKQRDITQQYADDVNSIEDELKTARGDRRQQLIDQLNAEMAAQRESLAQEKKIEKEKEKAEEKKKKLEREQAEAEKDMAIWQAAINAAMAVSMAAVNHWPIPAIPMMAMASAVGAAQIAAVKSKPIPTYATGGVIEGKSHAQGGVKVLGGRAEVEGREFITNKVTTQENVDLMYFVNSKKRKLNLDDFIDFYSSGAVRKNIQSVKTRFADGGQIPVLSNSIDINDRMITAMEDYSNRPVVVSVVDIIDRTQRVNDVKVMAGLND